MLYDLIIVILPFSDSIILLLDQWQRLRLSLESPCARRLMDYKNGFTVKPGNSKHNSPACVCL